MGSFPTRIRGIATAALIAGTAVGALSSIAIAQDSHYWSIQYGTRSELLGGNVVGRAIDLSANYYNPGALSLLEGQNILLSAQAWEYRRITVGQGLSDTEDLTKDNFGTAPSLFAGLLPSRWLTGQLGYSFLTRQEFKLRVIGRRIESGGPVPPFPSDVHFSGEYFFDQDLSEIWGGPTWSHTPTPEIGVGVTLYGAYRGQRTRMQKSAQAATDSLGATTLSTDEFDYWHFRFLLKAGVAWEYKGWSLGLTVTTPSMGLFGGGSVYVNRSVSGLDLTGDGIPDPVLVSNYQKDLKPTYKSPLSIAAGVAYKYHDTGIFMSAEWFNAVDEFVLLDSKDFKSQTGDSTFSSKIIHAADPVVNWGIGLEQYVSEYATLYAGFSTDFSSFDKESKSNDTVTSWDIYHVTLGAAANYLGADFTLGAEFAFGNDTHEREVRFSNPSPDNNLLGEPTESKITYRKLKFIFGFAFSF